MKRFVSIFALLVAFVSAVTLQSCSEDYTLCTPLDVVFAIHVVDENGSSIFNGMTSDDVLAEGISVSYNGEEYPLAFDRNPTFPPMIISGKYDNVRLAVCTPGLSEISYSEFKTGEYEDVIMEFGPFDNNIYIDYKLEVHFPKYGKTSTVELKRSENSETLIVDGAVANERRIVTIVLNSADKMP